MPFIAGWKFGGMLCQALGIDPEGVTRVTVVCDAEDVVRVYVDRLAEDAKTMVDLLTGYKVAIHDPDAPGQPQEVA
jgi:hypothetical protein